MALLTTYCELVCLSAVITLFRGLGTALAAVVYWLLISVYIFIVALMVYSFGESWHSLPIFETSTSVSVLIVMKSHSIQLIRILSR